MDLRPRQKQSFSGFTKSEVEKMEKLIIDAKGKCMDEEYCKNLARVFNRSSGRAGKPAMKWNEIRSWFQKNQENCLSNKTPSEATEKEPAENASPARGDNSSKVEFESRSSKDGAWYDIEKFLAHRFLSPKEIEIRVRYVGFGAEEDEWVNLKDSIRVRSIPFEHHECNKIKVGYAVVCFQENQNQAKYYDARVVDVQRRLHDIRGCRCLFLIRYDHDRVEEQVRLTRLCCRAEDYGQL